MLTTEATRQEFRQLHESGCFVMPNPWDIGSARYLAGLGFKALATTSAGLAFSHGMPDRADTLSRELALRHTCEIVGAVKIPVNADFQNGYAKTANGVEESVRLCAETGVAGLSIEDSTENAGNPVFEISEAVERVSAAKSALAGTGVLLTARAECFLYGIENPLAESIRRLQRYAEAGADVLFAPGIKHKLEIQSLVAALSPKPVNILISGPSELTVTDLAELGVRRISVGGALFRAAWRGFFEAAGEIADHGSFSGLVNVPSHTQLNDLFG